jgi:hypothetical protein
MRDRATRRLFRDRARSHAARVICIWGSDIDPRYFADNLKKCSCPICGNPRKWQGELTIQEIRASRVEDWADA